MLTNKNIICISSIDWDFIWQGHQEIMSIFARNGNRVLFIENTGVRTPAWKDIPRLNKRFMNWVKSVRGFREETKNLFVYSPLILPFPYSRIARWINNHIFLRSLSKWLEIMRFHEPIIWTFLPTGIALDIINSIDRKLLIYYCIADFYELVDNPKKVMRTENELIKNSDLIFVQGKALEEKCKRLNKNVYIYPFGVKMETFDDYQHSLKNTPDDIQENKGQIIGYIGGIHRHIDLRLIKFLSQKHPEWSIVLIGPLQTDVSEISHLENIFLLGKKEFSSLPNYIAKFDVGIIPYCINSYTITVFPTKMNEYHAMGKPVVSTNLPEVVNFNAKNDNLVLVGRTYEEFDDCITKALQDKNAELIRQRILSAHRNSWTARIEEMSQLIETMLEEKAKSPIDWRANFLKFYRAWRRKIAKITSIILCIYILIFHTSLIWFLAGPLKISEVPKKADCIVVFAGGVGESGKAGQGYEERVQHAVELYKNGYASNMIFSSGYMLIFKEPLLMEALAVSLGVTKDKVILEDKAKNTYENVKFTKKILEKNHWHDILLISSPYHMRRVKFVFSKVADNINVIYSPIPRSSFYGHLERGLAKRISLQQIRGIMHEYLGILYYWWKGWI